MNRRVILLMANDIALAFLTIPAAFLIRFQRFPDVVDLSELGMVKYLLFVSILVMVSFFTENYKYSRESSNMTIAARIILSLTISLTILSTLYYSAPFFMFGRGVLVIALVFFSVFQYLFHASYRICGKFKRFAKRILILGTGPLAGQMGEIIPATDGNYILSGYVSCSSEPVHVPAWEIVESQGELYETVRRENADKIVVSLSERRGVLPLQEIMACKLSGIEVVDAPSFYETMTGKLLLENITPGWFIFSEGFRITAMIRLIKRVTDLAFSALGLCLVLPFIPLIALAIKLDSPGPIFFRQLRVGEREKNFFLYKFRTMRDDAENGTGAVWAQEKDPRVTRVGNFFRKSRIDEIPQLFNVLMGDMSLVGPRPERPEFIEKLKKVIPYYSERHFVKPGVTGWAQVRYPYGASVEDALEKLRYDLYYIKNLSITFDLMIILETVNVVLFRRGGR
ncbi:MAG: TIGR03013 family XrtA/PEP-CTERM system glycosyltransferase [Geobacteraceae bacterium]|jgi:sugar transferase (PEP-CTERM system associated)